MKKLLILFCIAMFPAFSFGQITGGYNFWGSVNNYGSYWLNKSLYLNNFVAPAATGDTLLLVVNPVTGLTDTFNVNRLPGGSAYALGFWNVIGNTGTDTANNFIGTLDDMPIRFRVNSEHAGMIGENTSIGMFSNGTDGSYNSCFGTYSLSKYGSGNENTAIGYEVLKNSIGSEGNTSIGSHGMTALTTGIQNTGIGTYNNTELIDGNLNTSLGYSALYHNKHGSGNTAIGALAIDRFTGNSNIGIGHAAGGYSDTNSSNKLFINSIVRGSAKKDTTHSILFGVQDADSSKQRLRLNANVYIGSGWKLPFADGTAGQALVTNGSGSVSWGTVTQLWQKVGTQLYPSDTTDSLRLPYAKNDSLRLLRADETGKVVNIGTIDLATETLPKIGVDTAYIGTVKLYDVGGELIAVANDTTYVLTSRSSKGAMHVAAGDTTNCVTANTYYKIKGTWTNGVGTNFATDGLSKITYTGIKAICQINGFSDLTCSDNTATVTYGMFKNGTLITGWETATNFYALINIQHIAIAGLVWVNPNDYFEVWCKSDKANTIVTHTTLGLTFDCDR